VGASGAFEANYVPLVDRTSADVRRSLGRSFEREWDAGKALSLEEAAAFALGET
jgi:hypothetical protein